MSKKEALRELQNRLAERMKAVRTEQPGLSWLAVDCAGQGVLFPLRLAAVWAELLFRLQQQAQAESEPLVVRTQKGR